MIERRRESSVKIRHRGFDVTSLQAVCLGVALSRKLSRQPGTLFYPVGQDKARLLRRQQPQQTRGPQRAAFGALGWGRGQRISNTVLSYQAHLGGSHDRVEDR